MNQVNVDFNMMFNHLYLSCSVDGELYLGGGTVAELLNPSYNHTLIEWFALIGAKVVTKVIVMEEGPLAMVRAQDLFLQLELAQIVGVKGALQFLSDLLGYQPVVIHTETYPVF